MMVFIRSFLMTAIAIAMALGLSPFILLSRLRGKNTRTKPRLLWGTTSIVSLPMNAQALRNKGYVSHAFALANPGFAVPDGFHTIIKETGDSGFWNRRVVGTYKAVRFFIAALNTYDIFHFFFTGGILRKTPLMYLEFWLLKLAGKQVIVFPYGSDAFAPSLIPYSQWRDVLVADYPSLLERDKEIVQKLSTYCRDAEVVVGCLVHQATLPRWDALMLTCYPVETDILVPVYPSGKNERLKIFHAPNHRTIKGTSHLIDAVKKLQAEGLNIELDLAERCPHAEVLERMSQADLVVDQLNFGYGLTALEAMALGKMVITGKNPPEHDRLFEDYGLNECPAIWSSPGEIEGCLQEIASKPDEWQRLGEQSRSYAERYHSTDAIADNWIAIYKDMGLVIEPDS